MATLVQLHPDGTTTQTPIFKSLTTIGGDPESDVVVAALQPSAAHITYDGERFTIASSDKREIEVGGKRVRKQVLVDEEEVVLGEVRFRFLLDDKPKMATVARPPRPEVEAWQRLVSFSQHLSRQKDVGALLEALMDEIIGLTHADKGFLVLLDPSTVEAGDAASSSPSGPSGTPRVRVARNVRGENLEEAVTQLSDSILKRVLSTGQPVVVSDALTSTEFNSSLSVVSLKLTSVMCVPLVQMGLGKDGGGEVIGAIYVGNNAVKSLFDDASLEVLTLFATQASLLIQNALAIDALTLEAEGLKGALSQSRYGELIGACDGMREVFKKIEKVARADISVLITGETGTGKELIAREIHKRSGRSKGPLVVINCGAIPENLLESELFGHVKGAFTGAIATRPGKFQAAHGGTLFLDEIGEMPLHLQVKILRALQERMVQKVGDTKSEAVDIRVLAATHRNLDQMVKDGQFREDLYYRLNVVQLHLPPLRDRGDDVVVIANFLLKKYCDEQGFSKIKGFTPRAMTALRRYPWPGNVRQLENRLKRAIVLCEGSQVGPDDLDIISEDLEDILPLQDALERFRRRYIDEALERNSGNRTKTARELGVDPRTVFRHLEQARDDGAEGPG